MGKTTAATIKIIGDSKSLDKALDNTNKRLDRTKNKASATNKDVTGLGKAFTQTANNVSIFNGQLDPISGRLSSIGTGISRFGVGMIALGASFTAFTLAIAKAISSGQDFEQRTLRFNALLKATSYQSGLTTKDLEALANQIGKDTLSNTKEASEGINALLTFKRVQGEVFKETITLARDSQVAFGGGLTEAVTRFGRALNDPISNLGSLNRIGITFSDDQEKQIRNFWEWGDAASAQNIILDEMRKKFGGLATEEAKTLRGSIDGLEHSWDRMWEAIGNTETMTEVTAFFQRGMDAGTWLAEDIARQHSEEAKRKDAIEKSNKAYDKYIESVQKEEELRALIKQHKDNKDDQGSVARGAGYRNTVRQLEKQVELSAYLLDRFENNKIKSDKLIKDNQKNEELQAEKEAQGRKARAEAERIDNENRLKEVLKQGDKLSRAIDVRYENEREKEDRKLNESLASITEQYSKEINAADKTGHDKSAIEARWIKAIEKAKIGYQDRLDLIADREAKRDKAEELRVRRAKTVALNEYRKQQKFLAEVKTGDSELKSIEFKYEEDLRLLQETEFKKKDGTAISLQERLALVEEYSALLKASYDKDVADYIASEASKKQAKIDAGVEAAGDQFNKDVDLGFSNLDSKKSALTDFFGFQFNETQNQLAELERVHSDHLTKLEALDIDQEEKDARRKRLKAEFDIKQEELKGKGVGKANSDMWSAIETIGSSGSKKAFAIAKAFNMAKTAMNTADAVMNVYANIPPPFNIPAAIAVGAAGALQLNTIRQQEMPQFHDGINYVPREGSYLLDKGERVLDSRLNNDLTSYLSAKDSSESGNVTVNLSIPDTGSYNATNQWYEDNRQAIANDIRYSMERI